MENNEERDFDLKDALEEEYDEMVVQRADVMENVGKKVKSTVLNVKYLCITELALRVKVFKIY